MAERKGAYLFTLASDPDRPVPKVNDAHESALRDSKVAHFRLYDLRHTWATRAAEAGVDLVTLAAMLGHSKINMVLRYAHPTQEHQTKATLKIERHVVERQIEAAAVGRESKSWRFSRRRRAGSP
jgi:integrase